MLTVLLLVLLLAVIALAAVPDEPARRDGLLAWWLPEPNAPPGAERNAGPGMREPEELRRQPEGSDKASTTTRTTFRMRP